MTYTFPSISVIIPVYNGEQTLSRCLESLLNQNYPRDSYEIIVVENGSTDATTEVAQRYPVRVLHNSEQGPASARNMGIANSQAEIIAFTDADCIAHVDWLRELVQPYSDPEVGGVAGEILAYEHDERNITERFSDEFTPLRNFTKSDKDFLPYLFTANASYRRTVLVQLGGFNASLFTGEDVDLSWRLQIETNLHVCYVPQAIIYHHHRSSRRKLARQYRQYGFGEIMLDTMYKSQPGYPRTLAFQLRLILKQSWALPRYLISMAIRHYRRRRGRITLYHASIPVIFFLIESSNILGKLDALVVTRLMTNAHALDQKKLAGYIRRYY